MATQGVQLRATSHYLNHQCWFNVVNWTPWDKLQKQFNTLSCLDQCMSPTNKYTSAPSPLHTNGGKCPQHPLPNPHPPPPPYPQCRWMPPSFKMCYQALMISTQHQVLHWRGVPPPPCRLTWGWVSPPHKKIGIRNHLFEENYSTCNWQ